jgi:hypothetical protein
MKGKLPLGKIAVMLLLTVVISSGPTLLSYHTVEEAEAIDGSIEQLHGGGTGSVICPDGSSIQANIAFLIFENNIGQISSASWNIQEFGNPQNPSTGFANGSLNKVDITSNTYKLTGEKINEIQFCPIPISMPITIRGQCGENVTINVKFESNNPISQTGGSFAGDVLCIFPSNSTTM